MQGYLRSDGRKGIRNRIVIAYLVECAHHVSRLISSKFNDDEVHLIGFPGCFPNEYAQKMMERLCTHPNVGGVLLISLGCESFDRFKLEQEISASGRPVKTLVIQKSGGTRKTSEDGIAWVNNAIENLRQQKTVPMDHSELIIGTICGGSDGTSGISGNPAAGYAFDRLGALGSICIFEETGELIGCEEIMAERAATDALGDELRNAVDKAAKYYQTLGFGSFAAGNAEGGLSTIEEKSLGAYSKSGSAQIVGIIKPGDIPKKGGLYLMDVVPDGGVQFGFPNISDNAEIIEMIASGAHVVLFITGRGSVVGSAISPVIKICANPDTYDMLADDMDINAGRIINQGAAVEEIGDEIFNLVEDVATGTKTVSEEMGHSEFILTYKKFEPIGPSCLPI